jgi:hypothetical protein
MWLCAEAANFDQELAAAAQILGTLGTGQEGSLSQHLAQKQGARSIRSTRIVGAIGKIMLKRHRLRAWMITAR